MPFNPKHNFAMVQEYSGIFHHGDQYVGALGALVTIFTTESRSLFWEQLIEGSVHVKTI